MKNSQPGGNFNSTPVSRNYSLHGRPSVESSRPIPPPKPVFSSDDPYFSNHTLGRQNHRKVGASGDWHSGGSDSAGSPDMGALRYGSESSSNDLNSNAVVSRSSRSRQRDVVRGLMFLNFSSLYCDCSVETKSGLKLLV